MASQNRRSAGDSPGVPERSSAERSEAERSGGTPGDGAPVAAPTPPPAPPDPEVLEKPQRHQYPAAYRLKILQEADALKDSGQIGALLRREGLYSSHLVTWRRQREQGALAALSPKTRGRKLQERNPLARRVAELEAENRELNKRFREAETIIEVQKKLCGLLEAQESPQRARSSS
jgi:hypothetical protein